MVVTATTQPTIVEVRMARVVICLSRRTSCRLDPIPILLGRSGTCVVVVVVSGSEGLGRDEAGVEEISPPPTLRRFFDAGDGAVLAVLVGESWVPFVNCGASPPRKSSKASSFSAAPGAETHGRHERVPPMIPLAVAFFAHHVLDRACGLKSLKRPPRPFSLCFA